MDEGGALEVRSLRGNTFAKGDGVGLEARLTIEYKGPLLVHLVDPDVLSHDTLDSMLRTFSDRWRYRALPTR